MASLTSDLLRAAPVVPSQLWRMSRGGRSLVHADGTPAILVADTASVSMASNSPRTSPPTPKTAKARASMPRCLHQAFQRDMNAVGPRDRTSDEGFGVGFEDLRTQHLNELNVDYFRHLDTLLGVLVEHEIVPVLQPVFQGFGWKGLKAAGGVVPPGEYARYCRYLVARYGAPTSCLAGRGRWFWRGAAGRGGWPRDTSIGYLWAADRHPLPSSRQGPRPSRRGLAGLPVGAERGIAGTRSGAHRRHVEKRARWSAWPTARRRTRVRAEPRSAPGGGKVLRLGATSVPAAPWELSRSSEPLAVGIAQWGT